MKPELFSLGQIVATPGAIEALSAAKVNVSTFIIRHHSGDWGDLVSRDIADNERAVTEGLRIFSAYKYNGTDKIWIITEADRSSTTLLLPEEY